MSLQALVVDDDPVSMLVAQHVLVREDWHVATANSVDEALRVVASLNRDLDIVVCDYHMPGGSGLELFEALRERDITAPFLLLTGVGEQGEVHDDRVAQISGFLTKPVHSADLLTAIEAALNPEPRVA